MIDQVGTAIATADGADFENVPARYRGLALAVLTPLARLTEAMVHAAHWAINNRADFKEAVQAMIRAVMER